MSPLEKQQWPHTYAHIHIGRESELQEEQKMTHVSLRLGEWEDKGAGGPVLGFLLNV